MLTIRIKKQSFNEILDGRRKEEYLDMTDHRRKKLYDEGFLDKYGLPVTSEKFIKFVNGKSSLKVSCSVDIKPGKSKYDINKEYYVIRILHI